MNQVRFLLFGLLFLSSLLGTDLLAQQLRGTVLDEYGEPVPYANVFIRQLETGTSTDEVGAFSYNFPVAGEYDLVFSSVGYESQSVHLVITDGEQEIVARLPSSSVELNEIMVRASGKNVAYEIIRQAIERKKANQAEVGSYRARVYVKATEEIESTSEEPEAQKKPDDLLTDDGTPVDPFAAEEQARKELLASLNMVEMEVWLNYQYPKQYKEERTAYQEFGSTAGLFLPNLGETDFNFYRNLVRLDGISDVPVISPLSATAILSYKYKLLASEEENGVLVHKIEVIPRKKGNATVAGYLYINEGTWEINRLDLELPEGGLKAFDALRLIQNYRQIRDSLWVPGRQEFRYETTQGKRKTFRGTTILSYSEYQPDYEFPDKFFGNEIAVTTREAYQRDSSYWQQSRTEKLNAEEQKMVYVRDSIDAVVNSPEYQDSIQALYNRVSLLEVAWEGIGIRNNAQKTHTYIGSLATLVDFDVVSGFRLGPYLSHFKRFDNGKVISNSGTVNIGLRNGDIQGNFSSWLRYDPYRLGDISLQGGRSFQSINQFDAYLNQLKPSNYILQDALRLGHRIELLNGLYIESSFGITNRASIKNYDSGSFLDDIVEDDGQTLDFEDYQAFISTNTLAYTPGQRYMTEPNRKIVLGSNFPTFSLTHRKGWQNVLSSDIDFDYLEFAIEQDIIFGMFGNSKYRAQVGQFVNTRDLRFVDWKRFREADPYLYSDPLRSFQALDTSLTTTDLHVEFHHIHHFNGALINNIPLLKKTDIRTVAGGGFLWLQENNFRHQEAFVGLERVFKLGARRRLRVGLYGVLADSNQGAPTTSYKISFDLIDTWKRDWSF